MKTLVLCLCVIFLIANTLIQNESVAAPSKYFLTSDEIVASRGGVPRNDINPYTLSGNSVELLINGDEFFSSLYQAINATQSGDFIWMTGWDMNADIMLKPDPQHPKKAALSKIQAMLLAAIERNVEIRILINFNIYIQTAAIAFCRPLNAKAGQTVCAPDQRHNSQFGSLHQKAWVLKRNNETIAYVGSMDIMSGRYDNKQHNQDAKWRSEPKFFQPYYGWTDGMLEVKGSAVVDIARHLYQQITDPTPPFPFYTLQPTNWPNPPVKFYKTDTQIQTLFTAGQAGAIKYGYYSNWAPRGETSILAATLKAIQHAKQYIFISDQYLWYPQIMHAVAAQLPNVQAVVLVNDAPSALDYSIAGFDIQTAANAKNYYQYHSWGSLVHHNKVSSYQVIKEGRAISTQNIIYSHWKVLIIDDNFALIGTAGIEQAGMTNDIDMSLGIYDPQVIKAMRKKLWSEYLNLPYPNKMMNDPVFAIQTLWPHMAANTGRVRHFSPQNVSFEYIFPFIFGTLEPCGYLDTNLCQSTHFRDFRPNL